METFINTNNMETPDENNSPSKQIAHGIMWLLFFLGWGGCVYLSNTTGPIVKVDNTTVIQSK